jgi:hypothetical protein
VILTLAWKEYREHRAIWLTMVVLTAVLGFGLAQLMPSRHADPFRIEVGALAILTLAATYGVVCGSMMFAGEWEAGTMTFLDIFLGRRGLLWLWKFLIGLPLALTEALAVALLLVLLNHAPPETFRILVGGGSGPAAGPAEAPVRDPGLWFLVLPGVTLEAFAWGLLGSALTRRVLSGAGLAALMVAPFWLITIFTPPEAFLLLRLAGVGIVLYFSWGVLVVQSREISQPASSASTPPPTLAREVRGWDWEESELLEPRREGPGVVWGSGPPLRIPEPPAPGPVGAERVRRRPRHLPQARSPGQVLRWLTFRQAAVLLAILALAGLVVGLLLPSQGSALWPAATLLLGVACGTAAFAPEQRELSYQFLAAQHLPLKKFWTVKVLFWSVTALLVAQFAGSCWALGVLGKSGDGQSRQPFGTLPVLMGPVVFSGIWVAYGFTVAQVFVLLCRKALLAVILSALVGAAAVGLWLPSLLCGGMGGWQVWVPPLVLLVATRCLVRAWAGGRIKERKPLAALVGFGLAALAWAVLNHGLRAWVIPDVGAPLDREAFRDAISAASNNRTGPLILKALADMNPPEGKEKGPWLDRMAEVVRLPVGVIQSPPSRGQAPVMDHLPGCQTMADRLRALSRAALGIREPRAAWECLTRILALSRTLRNKAPLKSYLVGLELEESALAGLDEWLASPGPSPGLVRNVLDELNRHAALTPPPLDCLQTECYRSGGQVDDPTSWTFYSGSEKGGRVREKWLAGGIALSLDMPWEKERKRRLWRVVWAGFFRGLQTPYWQLPETSAEPRAEKESTRRILQGWLPAADGEPGSSVTPERLGRLLDASWVSDEQLFPPVVRLRSAATRARWRLDSARLAVALALYRLRERKPAATLKDLVPRYLPELPVDPYSGKAFGYRISKGERLAIVGGEPGNWTARPGQGVIWSTGPDRLDHGGLRHGGALADDDPRWTSEGCDLITVVPPWR